MRYQRSKAMMPKMRPLIDSRLISNIFLGLLVRTKRHAVATAKMISTTIWPSVEWFLKREPARWVDNHESDETILPSPILAGYVVAALISHEAVGSST